MIMSGQITLVSLGFMLGIDIVKGLFLCCTFLWSMVNLLIILLLNSKLLCWLSTLLLKRIVYFYSEFFLYKPRLILLLKEPQPCQTLPIAKCSCCGCGEDMGVFMGGCLLSRVNVWTSGCLCSYESCSFERNNVNVGMVNLLFLLICAKQI